MFPLYDINRSHRTPYVVRLLVLANLAVFVWQFFLFPDPDQAILQYGFIPSRFWADPAAEWPRIFSSMFMHGGLMHILGNMWFLWVFGDNIEDRMGHFRFLVFYLLGGVAAAITQGLVFASTDAAAATRNILKMKANGLEVGPILMGMGNKAHIVTPSITARGLLNISALAGTPVTHYG